jgi:hypothetical protein
MPHARPNVMRRVVHPCARVMRRRSHMMPGAMPLVADDARRVMEGRAVLRLGGHSRQYGGETQDCAQISKQFHCLLP